MLAKFVFVSTIGLCIATLGVALVVRVMATFLMVSFAGFNFKEKIFVSLAWIPKATVQVKNAGGRNVVLRTPDLTLPLAPVVYQSERIDFSRVSPDLHRCKWEEGQAHYFFCVVLCNGKFWVSVFSSFFFFLLKPVQYSSSASE